VGLLAEHARSARLIVTFEDHQAAGGFGSAVQEALSQIGMHTPVHIVGWPDRYVGHATDVEDLRLCCGLDDETLFARIRNLCGA
jgi:1-deoxy-D-xylulose-5-phosphate synthase